jgi:putative nucleotidyltransferase with HDIG domain
MAQRSAETPAGTTGVENSAAAQRLRFLFRHSLAAGCAHPLLHVMEQRGGVQVGLLAQAAEVLPRRPAPAPAGVDVEVLRRSIGNLPSLPRAVHDVMALLQNDQANIDDVAECIERDPALTARTLRIANSAFYGVSGRVGTIRNAIGVLGLRTVATLLTTAAVSAQFAPAACPEFAFAGYWRHAIATAIIARALACHLRMDDDIAFTTGLLHDIGRLALASNFPEQTEQALRYAREADVPALEAERTVLERDHVAVGALISLHWRLPPAVAEAIEQHHAPAAGAERLPTLADVLHMANALAHGLDPSHSAGEMVPAVDLAAWGRVGLSIPQCVAILDAALSQVEGLCEALAL